MAFRRTSLTPSGIEATLAAPAVAPPSGLSPDLNAANLFAPALAPTIAVFQTIALIAVLVRLYTQHFLIRGIVVEDYVLILAWVLQLLTNIGGIFCVKHGAGKHMWDVTLQDFDIMMKVLNYVSILYVLMLFFLRLAILSQFLRLFRVVKPFRIACWVCITVNGVFYAAIMVAQIVQCTPREKIWDPFVKGHCLNDAAVYEANAVFNIVSDFAILILPMPVVYRLQVTIKKKLEIMALFMTGFAACAVGAVRIYYTWLTFTSKDLTRFVWVLGLLGYLEGLLGILVYCLPVVPRFARSMMVRFQDFQISRSRSPLLQLSEGVTRLPSSTGRGSDQIPQLPYPDAMLESFAESTIRRLDLTFSPARSSVDLPCESDGDKYSSNEKSWTEGSSDS